MGVCCPPESRALLSVQDVTHGDSSSGQRKQSTALHVLTQCFGAAIMSSLTHGSSAWGVVNSMAVRMAYLCNCTVQEGAIEACRGEVRLYRSHATSRIMAAIARGTPGEMLLMTASTCGTTISTNCPGSCQSCLR